MKNQKLRNKIRCIDYFLNQKKELNGRVSFDEFQNYEQI